MNKIWVKKVSFRIKVGKYKPHCVCSYVARSEMVKIFRPGYYLS